MHPRKARFAVRRLAASLVAAIVLATSAGAGAGEAAADPCPGAYDTLTDASPRAIARATLCAVNEERRRHGLRALRSNELLTKAALQHSRDMVRRHYFSHISLGGARLRSRLRRVGYVRFAEGWHVGETLAWGSGNLGSPAAIVRSWMASPGHRAVILTPSFREIGIGVAPSVPAAVQASGATYTADFGVRG